MKDAVTSEWSHKETEKLVFRVQKNDLHAFGELYELYIERVYKRCNFVLKNTAQAEDASHDIFMKVLTKIGEIKEGIAFEAWLNRIVYNHCIDVLRKINKIAEKEKDIELEPSENLALIIEELESNKQLTDQLKELLDSLSELDRAILSLYYWEDYSVKEIAEILQLGESAVKMRMKRSRDHLKNELGSNNEMYFSLVILMILDLI